ncbi:small ribosomal subunit protein bS6m [Bacillus rossius redtenbacheri]|uniref:small ribosomal subunit protein bS6m n=1 Tax=Bacillus rossius redtenbacheri TaxID=93214 RepID=UPI002FDEE822
MLTYEMPILLRIMSRSETAATLKRTAEAIFETGGFIRNIENLGSGSLPYKTSSHGTVHKKGSHFLLRFHCPPTRLEQLSESVTRDVDVVRHRVYKEREPSSFECTLHEEVLPPAYRKDVAAMLEEGQRNKKKSFSKPFKYNTGLDYYPFQK